MSILAVWSQSHKIRLLLRDACIVLKKKVQERQESSFSCRSIISCSKTHSLISRSSYPFLPFLCPWISLLSLLINIHFLASPVEIYRAFLLALVPCKHGFPCHSLRCRSEGLLGVSSTKHSPPRSCFPLDPLPHTPGFRSEPGSCQPLTAVCFSCPASLPALFGKSFNNLRAYSWN